MSALCVLSSSVLLARALRRPLPGDLRRPARALRGGPRARRGRLGRDARRGGLQGGPAVERREGLRGRGRGLGTNNVYINTLVY